MDVSSQHLATAWLSNRYSGTVRSKRYRQDWRAKSRARECCLCLVLMLALRYSLLHGHRNHVGAPSFSPFFLPYYVASHNDPLLLPLASANLIRSPVRSFFRSFVRLIPRFIRLIWNSRIPSNNNFNFPCYTTFHIYRMKTFSSKDIEDCSVVKKLRNRFFIMFFIHFLTS